MRDGELGRLAKLGANYVDLSLPATEFVSYNKQLFGIRADIKYQGFKASFIGSRTKGTTKSKQFFGNTQFVATDLLDTAMVEALPAARMGASR